MFDTRRRFLTLLGAAGSLAILRTDSLDGQAKSSAKQTGRPSPPDPTADADEPSPTTAKSPSKIMLEANEKDIKKSIEKLYQLATDLKAEVDKTDSSKVLSLAMVKKAEEIEKLAHDIKIRAKG
jgi:nucleotide-binding universal stress UspA family protein